MDKAKRVGATVAAAIAVCGAIVWWWMQRDGDARSPAATTSAGSARGGSARAAVGAEAPLLAWFGVRGAPPQRIGLVKESAYWISVLIASPATIGPDVARASLV